VPAQTGENLYVSIGVALREVARIDPIAWELTIAKRAYNWHSAPPEKEVPESLLNSKKKIVRY